MIDRCFECDERGALLHCTLCQRGFHIVCAQTGKPLFATWLCGRCLYLSHSEHTEKDLKSQSDKLLEEQYKKKDAVLRKWKKLTKSDVGIFQSVHPELCNRGHVQYPIDDLLLTSRPKLHGIKGKPLPLPLPDPSLGKLFYIADFMFVFKEVFRCPLFSAVQLKAALQMSVETGLVKAVIVALETVGMTGMKKGKINEKAVRFRMAETLEIDLVPKLELCYLAVLGDLLYSWAADEDAQALFPLIEKSPLEGQFFSLYSLSTRNRSETKSNGYRKNGGS